MLENYQEGLIRIFLFWHFPVIFVFLKLTIFGTLIQNVNVAREPIQKWDFFCDFETLWKMNEIFELCKAF